VTPVWFKLLVIFQLHLQLQLFLFFNYFKQSQSYEQRPKSSVTQVSTFNSFWALSRLVWTVVVCTKCNAFHNKPCQYFSVTDVDFNCFQLILVTVNSTLSVTVDLNHTVWHNLVVQMWFYWKCGCKTSISFDGFVTNCFWRNFLS